MWGNLPAVREKMQKDILKVDVFSTGNPDLYSHLVNAIEKCESNMGWPQKFAAMLDGILNYIPDCEL